MYKIYTKIKIFSSMLNQFSFIGFIKEKIKQFFLLDIISHPLQRYKRAWNEKAERKVKNKLKFKEQQHYI